jgi:hypothetical protein
MFKVPHQQFIGYVVGTVQSQRILDKLPKNTILSSNYFSYNDGKPKFKK